MSPCLVRHSTHSFLIHDPVSLKWVVHCIFSCSVGIDKNTFSTLFTDKLQLKHEEHFGDSVGYLRGDTSNVSLLNPDKDKVRQRQKLLKLLLPTTDIGIHKGLH